MQTDRYAILNKNNKENMRNRCKGTRFESESFISYRWRGSIQRLGRPGSLNSPSWRCDSSCDRVSAQACRDSMDSTASWSRLWHMLELHSPIKQRDVLQLCQVFSLNLSNCFKTCCMIPKIRERSCDKTGILHTTSFYISTKHHEVSTETKHQW